MVVVVSSIHFDHGQVGGFKHGQRLKFGSMELVVIGVMLVEGRPNMFLQIVKPQRRPGAGMMHNLHLLQLKELGMQTVEEVMLADSDQHQESGVESTIDIDPSDSEAEHSSSESTPEHPKSSDAERAMKSTPHGGQALVLRLSHCNAQVKNMLLTSPELEDCRALPASQPAQTIWCWFWMQSFLHQPCFPILARRPARAQPNRCLYSKHGRHP